MNKTELVNSIAARVNVPKVVALQVLDSTLGIITQELVSGKDVTITGFGTLTIKKHISRIGRNPRTGEIIKINESKTVGFKTGKSLKHAINNNTNKVI